MADVYFTGLAIAEPLNIVVSLLFLYLNSTSCHISNLSMTFPTEPVLTGINVILIRELTEVMIQ